MTEQEHRSTRLHYNDYIAIRDLMADQEEPLGKQEGEALGKIKTIIGAMEARRRDEDAGIIPRTKLVWRDGRMVRVEV